MATAIEMRFLCACCVLLPASPEGFASSVTAFCEHLGYWEIHAAIRSFTKRVYKSRVAAQSKLAALTDIKGLDKPKARHLFDQGIKTAEQVAGLDVEW